MHGADFARKFGLIERAAARAEKTLRDQQIAWDLYLTPRSDPNSLASAKSRWSQRKNGWRHFEEDKLQALFQSIAKQAPGLLAGVTPDLLLEPFDTVARKFVTLGILRSSDVGSDPPLAEVFKDIQSSGEVIDLLSRQDHTITWSRKFRDAFDLVPECQERLVDLFYKAAKECTIARGRKAVLTLAAGTLTYVWEAFEAHPDTPQMSRDLEAKIMGLEPSMVFMAEPLSYIAALHGRPGAFKRNIERMITDPVWRRTDFDQRLHYYAIAPGGPAPNARARRVAVARNIERHLQARDRHSEILCQDIGRVIEVYPALKALKRYEALAELLKAGSLERLGNLGISQQLCAQAEDLMEGRRSA